ncbi:RNA-binding transcriptional accessory protein [Alishewanella sp. 16-MA]|uniref:RNA-binding transcriptional accessory protein n=1 Tax=Alishewanella maricola TaxID=2795740 RepID=A0ABS8C4L5_9ALTE|nr:Tex family protein [Alishewanella maricola]MCB5227262.1 RNA-binding transcriptional accessory protein [Alishewanella maricola]
MSIIVKQIAAEIAARPEQVAAAIALLDEGATVPFIARYRKEVTGALDDTQLRTLDQRLTYLRELEERRQVILKTIAEQGKLTTALEQALLAADNKTRLEDLYLPYKTKRRTKGQLAIEAGILPLAEALLANAMLQPEQAAAAYINADAGYTDVKAVLDGAKYILMEQFAEDADLLARLREYLTANAQLQSTVVNGKEAEGAKFSDYFSHTEPLKHVPSHRALAMFRGRNEGILQLQLIPDANAEQPHAICEQMVANHFKLRQLDRPADAFLRTVVQWTWKVKLQLHLENDLLSELRERSDAEAIKVFARNLKDLLMAAPAGMRPTLALDPGLRTGVKVTAIDETGKVLNHTTIYPHAPTNQWDKSLQALIALSKQYQIELIAVGNGTASRETDKLAAEVIKALPQQRISKVMVSEAGASVYSASELAALEFPDLDVSIRGAVSIGRRLQDPLAELVKIEPKAIGVGQYQHDVNQSLLTKSLDAVVEDCVNAVGVDLNTASAALLARVAGLNKTLAQNIVQYRDEHGRFNTRKQLLKVPRLGPKAYEQAAGFLRINNGENPLDASGVHPEAYPLVEKILAAHQKSVEQIIGNSSFLQQLDPARFVDEHFGLLTIADLIKELDKPGRDPRPEFQMAHFKEGVETLADLKVGMRLEGVVTNVTNFGAFVDVGVHQDGLVHISALADKFVSDPHQVVKAGDIVQVKVLEVDAARKRIALTMKLNEPTQQATTAASGQKPVTTKTAKVKPQPESANAAMGQAFAAALAKTKK